MSVRTQQSTNLSVIPFSQIPLREIHRCIFNACISLCHSRLPFRVCKLCSIVTENSFRFLNIWYVISQYLFQYLFTKSFFIFCLIRAHPDKFAQNSPSFLNSSKTFLLPGVDLDGYPALPPARYVLGGAVVF